MKIYGPNPSIVNRPSTTPNRQGVASQLDEFVAASDDGFDAARLEEIAFMAILCAGAAVAVPEVVAPRGDVVQMAARGLAGALIGGGFCALFGL